MKGSFNGLKAKEISLLTIILMCLTIVIWTWEKTPILSTFVPPQSQLHLSREISQSAPAVKSISSESEIYKGKDKAKFPGKVTAKEEILFDVTAPVGYAQRSPKTSESNSNLQSIHSINNVAPVASTYTNLSAGGKDEDSLTVHEEKQDLTHVFVDEVKSRNVVAPVASTFTNLSAGGKDEESLTAHEEKQECNYAKGKWVIDHNRPLYSGFGCKIHLSGMWACRLTQRTDFAYERLRWQPKNCQMEEFTGSKFLRRMQDKTLAFVGDSLGRQQFQSLMCMVTGGNESLEIVDVGMEYGIAQAPGDTRPSGWAYRFPITNTTILYYWSASLCDLEPLDKTNPATDYAMHLDQPAAFLRQFIHKFHVLVLNTGHHWNRGKFRANRWVMYVNGAPNTDKKTQLIWKAKNLTVHSVINWVNSQLPKYPALKVFYRTISPRHFVGGEWNTGGSCDNTNPMSVGKEVLQDESSDESAAAAVKGTGVKLLDITALSQLRDEAHISRFSLTAKPGVQDCLHWCLPGVPDTWNEILFAQI
ncbi:hypothetical protein FNV43_RR17983 [Rhamnella rubrinervis]|uniref:Trichome birefringence-like N-terminal domain-containing protein n=1 Tax=Rhamnella rubrinervis TaxID=2594499 RepID=A0A8K0GXZ4_9ROSA|nr:hypothetical protein FNV43_RR17983 [Rhamnella rubrinervis]